MPEKQRKTIDQRKKQTQYRYMAHWYKTAIGSRQEYIPAEYAQVEADAREKKKQDASRGSGATPEGDRVKYAQPGRHLGRRVRVRPKNRRSASGEAEWKKGWE